MKNIYSFSENFVYEWKTDIFEMSKIMNNEILNDLYKQNIFVVNIHEKNYRKFFKFNFVNLRRVHYFRIVTQFMKIFYEKFLIFDFQFWFSFLKKLLEIITMFQFLRKICANESLDWIFFWNISTQNFQKQQLLISTTTIVWKRRRW